MGKELIPPPSGGDIEDVALRAALEERYLQYALSTITGRALPDARDGLKPVHRRLLFAMQQLRLDPGVAFKKCARVDARSGVRLKKDEVGGPFSSLFYRVTTEKMVETNFEEISA